MEGNPATVVRWAMTEAGLGDPDQLRPAGAGQRNDVWSVDTGQRQLVVRLLVDDSRLAMEAALLERLASADVPVASVLWSAVEPHPVMIQTRLPGRRLADETAPAGSCRAVASTLARIHATDVPAGFGNLQPNLNGATSDLADWFVDRVRTEASTVQAATHDRRVLETALGVLDDARPLLARQRPGLVHGDYQPTNLLVDANEVTGVLDWEAAKSGPPAFDFGWWDWWSATFGTPWSTEALIAAYDGDKTLDRGEVDAVRRIVMHRIWTRELIAGIARGDEGRTSIAGAALTQSSY